MGFLLDWDLALFFVINNDLQNPLFDSVLPLVRNRYVWIPFYISIITYIFANFNLYKSSYYILILLGGVVLTDTISSRVVKNTIGRSRPCNEAQLSDQVTLRVRCGRGYSFTSSHATNHFGLAMILISLFGRKRYIFKWLIMLWASLISFAQIYVGVHYPLDVIAGACLGIALIKIYVSCMRPTLQRIESQSSRLSA